MTKLYQAALTSRCTDEQAAYLGSADARQHVDRCSVVIWEKSFGAPAPDGKIAVRLTAEVLADTESSAQDYMKYAFGPSVDRDRIRITVEDSPKPVKRYESEVLVKVSCLARSDTEADRIVDEAVLVRTNPTGALMVTAKIIRIHTEVAQSKPKPPALQVEEPMP